MRVYIQWQTATAASTDLYVLQNLTWQYLWPLNHSRSPISKFINNLENQFMFIFDFRANAHVHSVHETIVGRRSRPTAGVVIFNLLMIYPRYYPQSSVYLMQTHISNFLCHTQSAGTA